MITYILAEDATSYLKVTYAKKGDTVTLIKDCGRALIVENENGNRFPITSKNIISNVGIMEQPVHTRTDHLAARPGKQLRSKKEDKLRGSNCATPSLTLFE